MTGKGLENGNSGFTLVELLMIIILLAIISITVGVKWPSDMESKAAKLEFKQAVRFAQHMALTREWLTSAKAWSIIIASNKYYVGRADAGCLVSCSSPQCAEEAMCNRSLLGNSTITLSPATLTVLFNGLGEPIDATGALLSNTIVTIGGVEQLTVCAQTGYVLDGSSCP
jgi:Tfp pilus assembly protein FimT